MSTKSNLSIGEYHRLSMYDEACVLYNTQGQDFGALFKEIVDSPNGEQKYFFGGPDYLLLGMVKEDEEGLYWHVCYAAHRNPEYTVTKFLELAPFPLDRIEFCRYHKMNTDSPFKFYKWETFKRISKYGQQT